MTTRDFAAPARRRAVWLGLAVLLGTMPAVGAAPPARASEAGVVVSEFRTTGPAGGNDEFVEVHNAGGSTIDISGWRLQACAATSGAASNRAQVPAGVVLAPGDHLLFANTSASGYSEPVTPDVTYTQAIADDGGIRVVDGYGTVVDGVGSSAGAANECREGAGISARPTGGMYAFERLDSGRQDTDANAADFAGPKASGPQHFGAVPNVAPIHSVQGSGAASPVEDQAVTVEGIVTGWDDEIGTSDVRRYYEDAGVFLQARPADVDADPATSEGIFVAALGNRASYPPGTVLRVKGKVEERFGQTTLRVADDYTPTVLGTDAVPAPAAIDEAAANGQDEATRPYYETLEGMRVHLASGMANSGGTNVNDELFLEPGTLPRRIFRSDAAPGLVGVADDAGAGNPSNPATRTTPSSTLVDADIFDRVDELVGPLSYSYGMFKVLPQAGLAPTIVKGATPFPYSLPPPGTEQVRVVSMNFHNFLGIGVYNDLHYVTAAEFEAKKARVVAAINDQLLRPDVIVVQEVDSFASLASVAAGLDGYTPYLFEGNDTRGIDIGLLAKSSVTVANVRQLGKAAPGPVGETCSDVAGLLFDRPPLAADVTTFDGLTFTVLGNHFASKGRPDACRSAQAAFVRDAVAGIEAGGGQAVVAGDLNSFEDDPALAVLEDGSTTLTNQWSSAPAGERYSYQYAGKLQTLDHILVTDGLDPRVADFRYAHFDIDYHDRHAADDGHHVSDHDPPVLTLQATTRPAPKAVTTEVSSVKGSGRVYDEAGSRSAEVGFDVQALGMFGISFGVVNLRDTQTNDFVVAFVFFSRVGRAGLNGATGTAIGITNKFQFVNVSFSVDDTSTLKWGPDRVSIAVTGGYSYRVSGSLGSGDIVVR